MEGVSPPMDTILRFPLEVTLRDEELAWAYLVGRSRRRRNTRTGVHDLQIGDTDPWALDVQGMAAEVAFCRAANVFPDTDTTPRSDSPDCVLPSGIVIDVKGTTNDEGNLIAPITKHKNDTRADIAILVVGDFPFTPDKDGWERTGVFTIYGWAWMSDLLSKTTIRPMRGPTHFIERSRLYTELPLLTRPTQGSLFRPQPDEVDVEELFG